MKNRLLLVLLAATLVLSVVLTSQNVNAVTTLNQSLKSCWDMNSNYTEYGGAMFIPYTYPNPGAGPVLNTTSGSCMFGSCFEFRTAASGSTDTYFKHTNTSNPSFEAYLGTRAYTTNIWLKPTVANGSYSSNGGTVYYWRDTVSTLNLMLDLQLNRGNIYYHIARVASSWDTNNGPVSAAYHSPVGRWGMWTIVSNVTNTILYKNGTYVTQYPIIVSGLFPSDDFGIGRNWQDSVSTGIDQYADVFAMWNKTLSETEISELYNSSSGVDCQYIMNNQTAPVTPVALTLINFTSDGGLVCTDWKNSTQPCNDFAPTKDTTPSFKVTLDNTATYMNISYSTTNTACSSSGNVWTCADPTGRAAGYYTYSFNWGSGAPTTVTVGVDPLVITPTITSTNILTNNTRQNLTMTTSSNNTVKANLSNYLYKENSTDWRIENISYAHHYDFNLNNSNTNRVSDRSSYNANFTNIDTTWRVNGLIGGAFYGNSTAYIDAGKNVTYLNNNWSISVWLNVNATQNRQSILGDYNDLFGYLAITVPRSADDTQIVFEPSYADVCGAITNHTGVNIAGGWHNIVMVSGSNSTNKTFETYIDGVASNSKKTINCGDSSLQIQYLMRGYRGASNTELNGSMDELYIFENTALTARQARGLYLDGLSKRQMTINNDSLVPGQNWTVCSWSINGFTAGDISCSAQTILITTLSYPTITNYTVSPPNGTQWRGQNISFGSTWDSDYAFTTNISFQNEHFLEATSNKYGNFSGRLTADVTYFNFSLLDEYGNTGLSSNYNYTLTPQVPIVNISAGLQDGTQYYNNFTMYTRNNLSLACYVYIFKEENSTFDLLNNSVRFSGRIATIEANLTTPQYIFNYSVGSGNTGTNNYSCGFRSTNTVPINYNYSRAVGSVLVEAYEVPMYLNKTVSPASGSDYTGSPSSFGSTWTDLTEITQFTMVDGVNYSGNASVTLAAGTHYYNFTARDAAGNENTTETFTYILNKASNTLSLTVNGSTGYVPVTFNTTIPIVITQTGVDAVNFTLYGDNGTVWVINSTINTQLSITYNFTKPGDYYITGYTFDSENYTYANTNQVNVTVDSLPPYPFTVSQPNSTLPYTTNVSVQYTNAGSAHDYAITYNVSLYYNGSFLKYAAIGTTLNNFTFNPGALTNGWNYTIFVLATDTANKSANATSEGFMWNGTHSMPPMTPHNAANITLTNADIWSDNYNAQMVKAAFGSISDLPPVLNNNYAFMFMIPNSTFYNTPVSIRIDVSSAMEATSTGWSLREQPIPTGALFYVGSIYGGVVNQTMDYTLTWS